MKKEWKKSGKKLWCAGTLCIVIFVVWTMLIQMIDVQAVGPNGTKVGFASFNRWFHQMTGVHMMIYTITDWLGLILLVVCLIFGGLGCVQLIQRRSLFRVDHDIIVLGIYYVVVICCYLIFEMFPVNYRPILIEGRMEASYPSSTTLLVLCVMPTLIEQINRRWKHTRIKRIVCVCTIGFSVGMVLGRLVSGVHWFTDIVGGVVLSAGLFCIYKACVLIFVKKCD